MATQGVSLFWQPTQAQIATIQLDASVKESHKSEVASTDSPVETGQDITDFLRAKPDTLTITGIVTDWPLNAGDGAVPTNYPPGAVAPGTNVTSLASFTNGRAEAAYAALLALKGSPNLITVITELRTYENMALISLDVPRDAMIGESLQFTATFKEIQIVQNATVSIARSPINQPNVNTNKQGTQPANQSIAAGLADTGAKSKTAWIARASQAVGGQASAQ